jgi:HSP20 family protein
MEIMSMNNRNEANWLPIVLDDMLKTDWLGGTTNINNIGTRVPAVNILETEDIFLIEVAVPGKAKKDLIIELENDMLSISSEEKEENKTTFENGRYNRTEFNFSHFKRVFGIHESVDREKISASYNNGILEIILPKLEEAKDHPKRFIKIS